MRIAFAGFRHGHILELYDLALTRRGVEVVGACEDHEPTRKTLAASGKVTLTHADYRDMLAEVDCDAVAVGDYYGRRGEIIIAALNAGRHVIADKPLCTSNAQLHEIAALAAEKNVCVGCMLTLRDEGVFRTARRLISEGAIGEVHTVSFTGQHPLCYGSRPAWYFEEGKHGGTINDIAVHAIDLLPWLTGRKIVEVVAARVWNARLREVPSFQDGAQVMFRLDNGGGALGDVSYLAPDRAGYSTPPYWRVTCHGDGGMLEASLAENRIFVCGSATDGKFMEPGGSVAGGYFESFRREIEGKTEEDQLDTAAVLEAARIALAAQQAAETRQTHLPL